MEGAIVPCAGKIEPFLPEFSLILMYISPGVLVLTVTQWGVTKLIAFKAQPTFTSKAICKQSDHLMKLTSVLNFMQHTAIPRSITTLGGDRTLI